MEIAGIDSNVFWVEKDSSGDTLIIQHGQMMFNLIYTSGTGTQQVNHFFNLSTGLSSGGSITLDLFDLTTTFFGEPFNFSLNGGKMKVLCVENLETGISQEVTIGFNGSNRFKLPFYAGDVDIMLGPQTNFLLSNKTGWNVNSTNRYIDLTDAGGLSADIEISILGSV